MKYFGSMLAVSDISPKNAHGWGLNLKSGSPISIIINLLGVPHTGSRIRNRMVLNILRTKRNIKTLVDVGGGIGLTGFYLNQFGYDYFGIDKSGYKIKIAEKLLKQSGIKNIGFVKADMFKNIPVKKKFDCALNMEVLEHVKDPTNLIKRISSLVKRGGYLILSFPSTHQLSEVSQKYFGHVRPGYEPSDIKALINAKYLKIESIHSFGNGLLSKLGFYIDYMLINNVPILAGVFFWVFYPIAVFDQKYIKSKNPIGYVFVLKKLK